MFMNASILLKLVCILKSLAKDSPLKAVSKNELNAALREINNVGSEKDTRECLNRVLVHLESAYSHYEPSSWNLLDDEDRVLWSQRTYKNSICLAIAIIHYYIGNRDRSRQWLTDELDDCGWLEMPEGALNLLEMSCLKDFFKAVYWDNGMRYTQIEQAIKRNYKLAHPSQDYNCFDYDLLY
jgi:hypothetical protein